MATNLHPLIHADINRDVVEILNEMRNVTNAKRVADLEREMKTEAVDAKAETDTATAPEPATVA